MISLGCGLLDILELVFMLDSGMCLIVVVVIIAWNLGYITGLCIVYILADSIV